MTSCPRCGSTYDGYPAISRTDNKTPICSPCGTLEALEDFATHAVTPQARWATEAGAPA